MYEILNELLSDKKTQTIFTCFGIWHILYMVVIFGIITGLVILFKNKTEKAKEKLIKYSLYTGFGLYILDFFLMPFAYGEIDLEKLPFHICTTMCVLCFLSRKLKFFSKYTIQFALLGMISNFVYVIYPGGVGQYQVHPLSYRTVQTLMFHGVMTSYGVFVLAFEIKKLNFKECYKDLIVICFMTVWAIIGNTLYNGNVGDYNHTFNWFFVLQDPFYLVPKDIAPFIMPFVNIIVFFVVDILVYVVYNLIKKEKVID